MECPTPCVCGEICELDEMTPICGTLPDGGNLVCSDCLCSVCDGDGECFDCEGSGNCPHCGRDCTECEGSGECGKCHGNGLKPHWKDRAGRLFPPDAFRCWRRREPTHE